MAELTHAQAAVYTCPFSAVTKFCNHKGCMAWIISNDGVGVPADTVERGYCSRTQPAPVNKTLL